jgi:hypothetical protein
MLEQWKYLKNISYKIHNGSILIWVVLNITTILLDNLTATIIQLRLEIISKNHTNHVYML